MFKKVVSLVLALTLCLGVAALTACDNGKNEKLGQSADLIPEIALDTTGITVPSTFKIGFIFLHDENSTYDLNFINGAKRVQAALGLTDDQVVLKKNIPEGNECYEAAVDLANAGCCIVFADSFGHESYLAQAAEEYPNVQFCHATGTTAHTAGLSNLHNAFASIYEGRYLAGIAAGLKLNELKEAGKLKGSTPLMGYVGAFTYAEVISGYTSFYLGAKSVCPDVQMKVQFTGSWYDETEEKNAAEALIAAGCDLISQHADSMGAPTACSDAGIPNVSYNGSTYEGNEESYIIASRIDWAPYFLYITKQVCAGAEIDTDWTGSIATGSVLLTGLNLDVAAKGTKEAIETAIAQFKAGTLDVFKTSEFTVKGAALTTYMADVNTDPAYTPDTQVISDGAFQESSFRSAPYFDVQIDGIELLNAKY